MSFLFQNSSSGCISVPVFPPLLYSPNISFPPWASAGGLVSYEAVCLSNLSFSVPTSFSSPPFPLCSFPEEVMFFCEAVPVFSCLFFSSSLSPQYLNREALSSKKLCASLSFLLQYNTQGLSWRAVEIPRHRPLITSVFV